MCPVFRCGFLRIFFTRQQPMLSIGRAEVRVFCKLFSIFSWCNTTCILAGFLLPLDTAGALLMEGLVRHWSKEGLPKLRSICLPLGSVSCGVFCLGMLCIAMLWYGACLVRWWGWWMGLVNMGALIIGCVLKNSCRVPATACSNAMPSNKCQVLHSDPRPISASHRLSVSSSTAVADAAAAELMTFAAESVGVAEAPRAFWYRS